MIRARFGALVLFGLTVIVVGRGFTGCSSRPNDEHLGTSRQPIIQAMPEVLVDGPPGWPACPGNHELDTAFLDLNQPLPVSPVGGRWLTVSMPFGSVTPDKMLAWYWSDTGDGLSWHSNVVQSIGQFVPLPGAEPCTGMPFRGYIGDPAVAPITHPERSGFGSRAIFVEGEGNDNSPGTPSGHPNVIAALWDDAAKTWTNPQYVTQGPPFNTCNGSDIPDIASNPVFPFDTFASWEQVPTQPAQPKAWLRKIGYDTNGAWCGQPGVCGNPIQIVNGAGSTYGGLRRRPNIAVGTLAQDINGAPLTCTGQGEAVYVVFSNTFGCTCGLPNCLYQQNSITWYLQIWDVVKGLWYGPWPLWSDPIGVPNCVGADGKTDNSADAHIAVDTMTDAFWVVHTTGAPCGATGCPPGATRTSQVIMEFGSFNCPVQPPPPCVEGQPCPLLNYWAPGGGTGTTAAWMPGIAAVHSTKMGAVPPQSTALYWYATDNDNGNNRNAAVFMSYQQNIWPNPFFGAITAPAQISSQSWDMKVAEYWDYQRLGANYSANSFLAVWEAGYNGCTGVPKPSGQLWASLLQPL